MMQKKRFVLLLLLAGITFSFAQEKKFDVSFSGFVKNDAFYDTRQTVAAREGHFLLYPANESLDPENADINATPSFNILAIQTRLRVKISGPDAFGAKTSGFVEGAFFGHSNSDVNGFRLRHAFVKLNWDKSELLAGQYWHPMFFVQVFPEVVSFNTGVPFQPFSRNPQLRYSYHLNNLNLVSTAYTLRDFGTTGPSGTATSIQRNAGKPNLNIAMTFCPSGSENVIGASLDYKAVLPQIMTDNGYKTNTTVQSVSAAVVSKLVFNNIVCKFQGLLAQNAYDILGIGGYAAAFGSYDSVTARQDYTNLKTGSLWTELYYKADKCVAGIFAGYSKNMGSVEEMDVTREYARGANIDYLYRVSPRLAFKQGKTTIATEIEYTTAAYAKAADIDEMGRFSDSKAVSNTRFLLSFIYSF